MNTASEQFSYLIGILLSLILHLLIGGLSLVLLESRAADAARAPQVFSVTLEGGETIGGITQVPEEIGKKEKKPLPGSVPETSSSREEEAELAKEEKKLEKPSVVQDPEETAKKKALEEKKAKELKLKQEAEKKKRDLEKKKKEEAEAKKRKAEEERKKKIEERKAKELARKRTNQRLKELARRARARESGAMESSYKGESSDGGGTGFGAAKSGQGGMGGGTLTSFQKLRYQAALKDHVKAGWRWLPGSKKLRASVMIRLLSNGSIQDVRIEVSSGNSQFDESVVRAVRKADPVPPPPPELYSEFSSVRIRFDSHE